MKSPENSGRIVKRPIQKRLSTNLYGTISGIRLHGKVTSTYFGDGKVRSMISAKIHNRIIRFVVVVPEKNVRKKKLNANVV